MKSRSIARTIRSILLCSLLLAPGHGGGESLAGWVESARIEPAGLELMAKLDTGAEHSSLHARDLERFEKRGQDWIRFRVHGKHGSSLAFERPLVRVARIKRLGAPSQERPVIVLEICVGQVRRAVEINLVDRSGFDYPLLLGRSFLAGQLVVDAARRELQRLDCPGG